MCALFPWQAQRFFKEHHKFMTEGELEGNKGRFSARRADMFNQIFYGYSTLFAGAEEIKKGIGNKQTERERINFEIVKLSHTNH